MFSVSTFSPLLGNLSAGCSACHCQHLCSAHRLKPSSLHYAWKSQFLIMHACQHAYFNNSEVHRFYLSRLVQYQLCQRRLWGPGPQEVGERGRPCLMLQCHHQNNSVLRGTKPTMQVQFCVKGDWTNNSSWPENRKCAMWKYHLQASFGSSVSIYAKEVLFLIQSVAPRGAAILIHSSSVESRKGLTGGVFRTFATQSGLVDDFTDTDSWTQSGCTRSYVFVTCRPQC